MDERAEHERKERHTTMGQAEQTELFVVERENGEWIDSRGEGGYSCYSSLSEAQDALDTEADCREDHARAYKIVRFVRI